MYGRLLSSRGEEEEHNVQIDLNLDPSEMQGVSDFKEKGVRSEEFSGAENRVRTNPTGVSRACVDCKTTKIPLWRSGPQGPKSLCNACGIRYRKRRRAALAFQREDREKQGRKKKLGVSLKVRFWGNEEEQAAVLLMGLSCGFVYA